MSDTEIRVVNEETGGAKGQKLAAFDLLPQDALWELARLYGVGAIKYDPRNWEKGYDWNLSYAAAQRHLNLFWAGEDIDPELKEKYEVEILHVICAAWHCLALAAFKLRQIGNDNRPAGAPIGGKEEPPNQPNHLGAKYPWDRPPWTLRPGLGTEKVGMPIEPPINPAPWDVTCGWDETGQPKDKWPEWAENVISNGVAESELNV